MSRNWRWCLKFGLWLVLLDLLTLALSEGQPEDSELRSFLDSLDQIANIMLFSYLGYRTGRDTGRATAGAEAGVIASLLPAVVAAIYQIVHPGLPAESSSATLPLAQRVIASIAFNVALGGVTAWLAGWMASRGRTRAR